MKSNTNNADKQTADKQEMMQMNIKTTLFSGLAMFRTTKGKIVLLQEDKLTIGRLIKYALSNNAALGQAAKDHILKHQTIHDRCVNYLDKHLHSWTWTLGAHQEFSSIEKDGFSRVRGDDGWWKVSYDRTTIVYPKREKAASLLSAILQVSTDVKLKERIQNIFKNAPIYGETTTKKTLVLD